MLHRGAVERLMDVPLHAGGVLTPLCTGEVSLPHSAQGRCPHPTLHRGGVLTPLCTGEVSLPHSARGRCPHPTLHRGGVLTPLCTGEVSLPHSARGRCPFTLLCTGEVSFPHAVSSLVFSPARGCLLLSGGAHILWWVAGHLTAHPHIVDQLPHCLIRAYSANY